MTNFEFKAKPSDFRKVRATLEKFRASFAGKMRHVDTYFRVARGRLKLREISYDQDWQSDDGVNRAGEAQLIFYQRPESATIKRSEYRVVRVADARGMRELLSAALGTRAVVRKKRELHLLKTNGAADNQAELTTRIHLDQVEGLGEFVEVEAVVGQGVTTAQASSVARQLMTEFGLREKDLIPCSYVDLMVENSS